MDITKALRTRSLPHPTALPCCSKPALLFGLSYKTEAAPSNCSEAWRRMGRRVHTAGWVWTVLVFNIPVRSLIRLTSPCCCFLTSVLHGLDHSLVVVISNRILKFHTLLQERRKPLTPSRQGSPPPPCPHRSRPCRACRPPRWRRSSARSAHPMHTWRSARAERPQRRAP